MFAVKNETELSMLGLKVHPGDPTQAVPLNQPTDAIPDESWSLDQLGQFAATGVAEAKRLLADATCLARKSTVQVFWAGCALTFAKPKVEAEGKKWGDWLEEAEHPPYQRMGSNGVVPAGGNRWKPIADLTLTQAKQKFGITKPPKPRSRRRRSLPQRELLARNP